MTEHFLAQISLYLGAAVICVPLARKLGLGAVLGYLIAGILIGPVFLNAVSHTEHVMHIAEFGVVMMLFLIGLELEPRKLWQLRNSIFGLGLMQMAVTTGALASLVWLFTGDWSMGFAVGLIGGLSSTAMVLKTLEEGHQMKTRVGQNAFSVLLFQDMAVIPIIAVLPLLGSGSESTNGNWLTGFYVLGALVAMVAAGHYLAQPVFRMVARSNLRELFTAGALLLVVASALLMQSLGVSPALGAFIAGVVLAESDYRHELVASLEPFKGLLLGVFFISVGAGMEFGLFTETPLLLIGGLLGFLALKLAVLYLCGLVFRMHRQDRLYFTIALAQGSEFAFVLLAFAHTQQLLPERLTAVFTLIVALSMAATPLLLKLRSTLLSRRQAAQASTEQESVTVVDEANPVFIAGFGRVGQVVGRVLNAADIGTTVLEHDADHLETIRRFGFKAWYGDARREDVLEAAGLAKAKLLVIAIDDDEATRDIARQARKHYPELKVIARVHGRNGAYQLLQDGEEDVFRETLDSAIAMAVSALRHCGHSEQSAWQAGQTFRRFDQDLMRELAPLYHDTQSYLSASVASRDTLARVLKADTQQFHAAENESQQADK